MTTHAALPGVDSAEATTSAVAPTWVRVSLVIGPLVLVVAALGWSLVGREPTSFQGMVRYFADNYSSFAAVNMVRLAAFSLMLALAAALMTIRGRRYRLRVAAGALLAMGSLGTSYNVGVDVDLGTAAHQMKRHGELDHFIGVLEDAGAPYVRVPILLGTLAFVLGLLLAGVSFWRHERAGRFEPLALVLGTLLLAIGGTILVPGVFALGAAIVLAATASLARRLGRPAAGSRA